MLFNQSWFQMHIFQSLPDQKVGMAEGGEDLTSLSFFLSLAVSFNIYEIILNISS